VKDLPDDVAAPLTALLKEEVARLAAQDRMYFEDHDTRLAQIRRGVLTVAALAVIGIYVFWLVTLPDKPAPGYPDAITAIPIVFAAVNVLLLIARYVLGRR
jgi:hypothetical protein